MFASCRAGRAGGRLLIAALLALLPSTTTGAPSAELRFPSRSPRASLTQWVGLTSITVSYESLAVGGRKVWGSAAAPGALWLVGEGEAPTISFSRDVLLAGASVPAGTYALLAVPGLSEWTVILNRRSRIRRPAERDQALDVAQATVPAQAAPHRERLAFLFSDFTDQHATLDLEWERVRVRIPIELETDAQVASQLHSLEGAWRRYADAAWLRLQKGTDLPAGLRYANQSIALKETWSNTWLKASLLAALGDLRQARVEADRALRLGRAAGSDFTAEGEIEEALVSWAPRPPVVTPSRAGAPRQGRSQPEVRFADIPFEAPKTLVVAGDVLPDPGAPLGERSVQAPRLRPARPPSERAFGPLIKQGLPDLRRCYERALRQDPSLAAARVTLSINVDSSGRVTKVAIAPPAATGALDACLKTTVGRWTFPASPTEYETDVPLILNGRS